MQNYNQEVIKVVMMNFLNNILPKSCIENNFIKPLDPAYLVELNFEEKRYDTHSNIFFSTGRALNFEALIELVSKFNLDTITFKDIFNMENKSLEVNPSELIASCNAYLNLYPLTCEALIEKSQNEFKISTIKAALDSIDEWNRSQLTIYSSIDVKSDTPIFVYHINRNFNIFRYEGKYYLEPTNNNYYGLRLILGRVFLIPNNYMVNVIRFLKKMILFRYPIKLFLKFINKNLSHNKTTNNVNSNNLLIIFINITLRLLKKSSLFICQYSLGLATPKSYLSFNDAKNAANL